MSCLPSLAAVLSFVSATLRLRRARHLLPLLALGFALPSLRAATTLEFAYTDTGKAIIIDRYAGSGGAVTIPSTINSKPVTSIGPRAFYQCSGVTSVTIPGSVTSIGDYAFESCDGLTSVTIPDRVASIGYRAFYASAKLTSVTIPASITSIGGDALGGCPSLTRIDVAPANSTYASVDGILFTKTMATVLQYPKGKLETAYTIPDGVTAIGAQAFISCSRLTSVTIPDGVISVAFAAFEGCSGLASVTLPDSVTSIGAWAFDGCSRLTSFTIPGIVTSIGDKAFNGCSGLTSITLPSSVTSIGDYAFEYCFKLTSIDVAPANPAYTSVDGVLFTKTPATLLRYPPSNPQISYTLPDGVTSIRTCAFHSCARLTSVTIPNGVTSIGNDAFTACTGLTSVTIPDSVTSIGFSAFEICSGLTSVIVPASVTSIGDYAFWGCVGLTNAIFRGNAPATFGSAVFTRAAPAFTIYYPSTSTGFTTPLWKGYPTQMGFPTFAQWIAGFGLGASAQLPSSNPSGDGLPNFVKYALWLDPTLPSSSGCPVLVSENGQLVYRVTLSLLTTGITSTIQTSADLVNWHDALTTIESSTATTVTASVILPTGTPRRFARLAVTQP